MMRLWSVCKKCEMSMWWSVAEDSWFSLTDGFWCLDDAAHESMKEFLYDTEA